MESELTDDILLEYIVSNEIVTEYKNDKGNIELKQLICEKFGFGEDVYQKLNDCGMNVESLTYIKDEDINELFLIKNMGLRVMFKAKLSHWRQNDAETLSVKSWLTSVSNNSSSSLASTQPQKLSEILQETPRGQDILQYFNLNSRLNDDHREDLINIIVDNNCKNCTCMSMRDIVKFSDEIKEMFPSEDLRYYFNFRGKGLNPVGKLYDKATNARRKMRKRRPAADTNISVLPISHEAIAPDEDNLDHKTWLLHNVEPWTEVCEKLKATFQITRQEILQNDTNILVNWPLFKNSLGLIEIDFGQLFPENIQGLFTKWDHFKEVILPYFKEKVKDAESKIMLQKLEGDISLGKFHNLISI